MGISWLKFSARLHAQKRAFYDIILILLDLAVVKIYLGFTLAVNTLSWLVVLIINNNISQNLVVLHYNVNFGINLIGSSRQLFIIPILGMIFILINLILAVYIYKDEKFIIHLLLAPALMANLFLFIATTSLYLINFS